jgi:hypothetical protein
MSSLMEVAFKFSLALEVPISFDEAKNQLREDREFSFFYV